MELIIMCKSDLEAIKTIVEMGLQKRTIRGSKSWRRNKRLGGALYLLDENLKGNRLNLENAETITIGDKFTYQRVSIK